MQEVHLEYKTPLGQAGGNSGPSCHGHVPQLLIAPAWGTVVLLPSPRWTHPSLFKALALAHSQADSLLGGRAGSQAHSCVCVMGRWPSPSPLSLLLIFPWRLGQQVNWPRGATFWGLLHLSPVTVPQCVPFLAQRCGAHGHLPGGPYAGIHSHL